MKISLKTIEKTEDKIKNKNKIVNFIDLKNLLKS